MKDVYKYNREGIIDVLVLLTNLNNNYRKKIEELTDLVNVIEFSSSWKDLNVKTIFISSCKSYIDVYNNLSNKMGQYIEYLKKKSDIANDIENICR